MSDAACVKRPDMWRLPPAHECRVGAARSSRETRLPENGGSSADLGHSLYGHVASPLARS